MLQKNQKIQISYICKKNCSTHHPNPEYHSNPDQACKQRKSSIQVCMQPPVLKWLSQLTNLLILSPNLLLHTTSSKHNLISAPRELHNFPCFTQIVFLLLFFSLFWNFYPIFPTKKKHHDPVWRVRFACIFYFHHFPTFFVSLISSIPPRFSLQL